MFVSIETVTKSSVIPILIFLTILSLNFDFFSDSLGKNHINWSLRVQNLKNKFKRFKDKKNREIKRFKRIIDRLQNEVKKLTKISPEDQQNNKLVKTNENELIQISRKKPLFA